MDMNDRIQILKVEKDGDDGLIVTFSDGTDCGYVVEELLKLRPIRSPAKTQPTPIAIVRRKTSGAYLN